jgi:hypothetical protein
MQNNLSAFVSVDRQFLRSVRLDTDYGRADALQGYVLQPSGYAALETVANYICNSQQRAFTWTGPYGGGKSSLALALASLAGGDENVRGVARETLGLKKRDPLVTLFGVGKPWTVLNIVGKRESIVSEIARSIDKNIRGNRGRKPQVDGRRDVITELVRQADSVDSGGVLLIIDELGKLLEHAAHNGDDVGFFQDLAETASRCSGKLVILGILHQSFEQYASRLGTEIQHEWAKVQGRYVDIPIVSGSDEVLTLISRALNVKIAHPQSLIVSEKVGEVIRRRRPSAVSDVHLLLDASWPLHPVTAALLGPASRRKFGQNERSVFGFLASAEPQSFSEVLKGLKADQESYYYPDQFWDYLRINFEPAILASSDSHRWASCVDAILRTEARFSALHVRLVKVISLIELFREGSGLVAEKDLLQYCVPNEEASTVDQALTELTAASILIFRKHLDAYGIYAGSDFDIEQAIRSAKAQIGHAAVDTANNLADLGPVTARRHYWNTGAMRWLSRTIVDENNLTKCINEFHPTGSNCGGFVLLLQSRYIEGTKLIKLAKKTSEVANAHGLLIGLPKNAERIRELLLNVGALEYVKENSRELHGDSVATTEINSRLRTAKASLEDELRDSFKTANWYFQGKLVDSVVGKNANLSQIASYVADAIYPESPIIHSELVNRNDISSSASKAQKDLLHRMLTHADQEDLAYTSYPADAGLYFTVLQGCKLHRKTKGHWRFCDPTNLSECNNISPAWRKAKELVFQEGAVTCLEDLYTLWRQPPFGIKNGLLPIFALAFFLTYRHQLALYIENTFTPELTEAYFDEWLQDPKRVAWRFVKIEGSEKKMLELLSVALSKRLNKSVTADALDSARSLVALVFQLPSWTRRTDSISVLAKDVRRLLLHASDPHKVLFADLPLVLGTHDARELSERIAEIAEELLGAYEQRLRQIESRVMEALDSKSDFISVNERGKLVACVGADFKLDAFATRLSTYTGRITDLEGLLMLAIGRPARDWTDHDINAGEMQLVSWAFEFRRLESLASVQDRPTSRHAIGVVFGTDETITGTFDVAVSSEHLINRLSAEFLEKVQGEITQEVMLAAIARAGATIFKELQLNREKSNG